MRHRGTIALLTFGLLLPLGACSDDDDDGGDDGATEETSAPTDEGEGDGGGEGGDAAGGLSIEGFAFTDVSVAAGADVEVTNADGAAHTVTSDDDAWDSVEVGGGESGSFAAPDEAGDYAFHCEIHPTMTGTLTVE